MLRRKKQESADTTPPRNHVYATINFLELCRLIRLVALFDEKDQPNEAYKAIIRKAKWIVATKDDKDTDVLIKRPF